MHISAPSAQIESNTVHTCLANSFSLFGFYLVWDEIAECEINIALKFCIIVVFKSNSQIMIILTCVTEM